MISAQKIVVLGGGFVAAEIAEFIAEKGKEVTMIEMREVIAYDMEPNFRQMLMERLEKLKIKMITKTRVLEVTTKGVKGEDIPGKKIQEFPADAVVVALGAEPAEFPVEELEKAGIEIHSIGDAKEIHGFAEATRDGFLVGITI